VVILENKSVGITFAWPAEDVGDSSIEDGHGSGICHYSLGDRDSLAVLH